MTTPVVNYIPQFELATGLPASGYWLKAYEAGAVSTAVTTYTSSGDVTGGTKFQLNSLGQPASGGTAFAPHYSETVDAWIFPTSAAADANDTSAAIQVIDASVINPFAVLNDTIQKVSSAIGSAADVITASLTVNPGALEDPLMVRVEINHGANTITNPTFNLNGLGAKTIKRGANEALQVGDTGGSGAILDLSFSETNDIWILHNPVTIKATQLTDSTIAGDGLAIASGVLSVNVDDSTIEISADTLQVKDAGIVNAKILDGTITSAKLADSEKVISSGAIGAVSELAFVLSTLDATQSAYNRYKIYLFNFLPATDDVELQYTLSSDAGSSYVSTGYLGGLEGRESAGNSVTNSWTAASEGVVLGGSGATAAASNAAGETSSAVITLIAMNTGASVKPHILTESGYFLATGAYGSNAGSGTNSASADYDAIKLFMESGNFQASGYYVVTKLTKPT